MEERYYLDEEWKEKRRVLSTGRKARQCRGEMTPNVARSASESELAFFVVTIPVTLLCLSLGYFVCYLYRLTKQVYLSSS